jgi:hypothetical protein
MSQRSDDITVRETLKEVGTTGAWSLVGHEDRLRVERQDPLGRGGR